MTDLERLAEACERAAETHGVLCIPCGVTGLLCAGCKRDRTEADRLRELSRALRDGRVTITKENEHGA